MCYELFKFHLTSLFPFDVVMEYRLLFYLTASAGAEFFADWDILICPISVTAPFAHDHAPAQFRRRLTVNGRPVPYFQQMFWAGLIGLVYLPSTVAPVGPGASGLPIGAQIVGPAFADRTTIAFADLLGREIGGYVPPPGYN